MIISNDKNKISHGALILTVTNLIISLLGLASSMLLSRYRTLDEYGTYSQVIMVTELVSTVLLMGLPQTVSYFMSRAENDGERRRFFTLYSILSTAITAIIGVCLYFSTPLIVGYFDNPYITVFSYVFLLYPWSSIMINTLGSVLVVYGRTGRLALYTLIHSLVALATVGATVLLSVDFERYVLIYIITTAVFAVIAYVWCTVRVGGFSLSGGCGRLLREILLFALPMGLASGVGSINIQLDKLFIGTLFSTEEYALYTNASRALPLTALATALTTILMPKLVVLLKSQRNDEAIGLWGNTVRISYIVMCALVAGLIVFAPDAMSLLYSEKYVTQESVAVFRIYTLTMLFKVTYFGIILNSRARTDLILACALLSLAANCVGNLVFYHLLGFIGPAVSTLLVTVIMNTAQLIVTSKITDIPFKRVFPYKALFEYTIKTVLVCIPVAIIYYTLFSDLSRAVTIPMAIVLGILEVIAAVLINKKAIAENWQALGSFEIDEPSSEGDES